MIVSDYQQRLCMCFMPNAILVLGFIKSTSYHESTSHCKQVDITIVGKKQATQNVRQKKFHDAKRTIALRQKDIIFAQGVAEEIMVERD